MGTQLTLPDIEFAEAPFDPIHVTFSGGAKDPFCRWYPYLEGFSPEFVRAALSQFAPSARRVLDPFGGTATTAFTCAELGLVTGICEVNPVMQFIFHAKINARTLSASARQKLARSLDDVAVRLSDIIDSTPTDRGIAGTYAAAFGDSVFFEAGNAERVLRARTLVDELSEADIVAGQLLCVAVLASLVPSSLLKRAGDLRFMTQKEVVKGIPTLDEVVRRNLLAIAADLTDDSPTFAHAPSLLCGDARELVNIPSFDADAVITSPPYINGTNYFRNTRLELWFLRCLRTRADLRYFREKAITGGINDVTKAKSSVSHTSSVAAVVRSLEESAYDLRIPMMVASYFAEMTDTFVSLSRQLRPGAVVAIDIGDSNYNGVHVPADALLVECFQEVGYVMKRDIELRKRRSKNGAPLRQALLVMEWPRAKRTTTAAASPRWQKGWTRFTSELPHQEEPFSARNWGSGLHSLCSYPGKLKPAIAHHLVETFVPHGGSLLDPFAGVGTIPFEAALSGRNSFSIDLSPAAFTVAAAKVKLSHATETGAILGSLARWTESYTPTKAEFDEASEFGMNGKIADFYNGQTLREVLALRRYFLELVDVTPSSQLVRAACLHLLHGNRPYAFSRRSHPLTPYAPTGDAEYRPVMPRIRQKIERSLSEPLPASFVAGEAFQQDCTAWWPSEVQNLDAVITSPPFFDSTRFHVQNWLRLWFTGWSPEQFKSRPRRFVDERQKVSFDVYDAILRQSKERLKPGGVVVWHLGKSVKCDMAEELARVGTRWFAKSELFDESVAHCESHGLRDKGTVTSHQYLILY
jgi:tRNA G10  N-methylase Trm11